MSNQKQHQFRIPLCTPNLQGNEEKYVVDCIRSNWITSAGSYIELFEESVMDFAGSKYGVSVASGTAGLHLALQAVGVEAGDYVFVPNITFVASCNAVAYLGAEPILVDICPQTWQMNEQLIVDFLEKNTILEDGVCIHKTTGRRISAIMPVHTLGNMCQMQPIMAISKKYNLMVVEDAAEALGATQFLAPFEAYKKSARYGGTYHAGTIGHIGVLSFNGNKMITTGGGGMVLTENEGFAQNVRRLSRQAKTDNFEYSHSEIGYNYPLLNILAAVGLAQMEQLDTFLARKKEINAFYREKFKDNKNVNFQVVRKNTKANNWLFTAIFKEKEDVIDILTEKQIQVRPFWQPMNQQQMFKKNIYLKSIDKQGVIRDFSNEIYQNTLSLPCGTQITNQNLQEIVNLVNLG